MKHAYSRDKRVQNKASHYLSFVKKGEDVLISERGKVIARVIKEEPSHASLRQTLHPLIMKGLVTTLVDSFKQDWETFL